MILLAGLRADSSEGERNNAEVGTIGVQVGGSTPPPSRSGLPLVRDTGQQRTAASHVALIAMARPQRADILGYGEVIFLGKFMCGCPIDTGSNKIHRASCPAVHQ